MNMKPNSVTIAVHGALASLSQEFWDFHSSSSSQLKSKGNSMTSRKLLLLVCRFTLSVSAALALPGARAAGYSYVANIGEMANGSNDVLVRISLRGPGTILATNFYPNLTASNGMVKLTITPPADVAGVSGYRLWFGVKPAGTTNLFSFLPPKKVKVQKETLVDATRDPFRLLLITAILGLIVFETRKKFTIPADVRYSTTRLKYEIAAFVYTLVWFVPFFTFLYSPDILYYVLGKERDSFTSLPSALVAGLATLYILPQIPGVKGFDDSIQLRLKDLAEIPSQLRWLHSALPRADFKPDPGPLADVLKVTPAQLPAALQEYGLTQTNPLNPDWVRAAILFGKLSELNAQKRFGSFFQQESQAWQQIEARFKGYLALAKTGVLDASFSEFYSDLHKFAARLVLFCGVTEKGRLDILHRRLGLNIPTTTEGVTFNQMTLIFLLLLSITITGLLSMTGSSLESAELKLLKGVMIASIYTCAVASAVYTSRRTNNTSRRAWSAYLVASVVSIVVSFVLAFAFGVMSFGGDIGAALINSSLKYPYLISAGFTCFATCIMLDTKATARLTPRKLRSLETLSGALLGLGLGIIVWLWLGSELEDLKAQNSVLVALLRVPSLPALCFVFVGLNTAVAALIPHWFRQAPAEPVLGQASPVKPDSAMATLEDMVSP
jgi:hypothetical protein